MHNIRVAVCDEKARQDGSACAEAQRAAGFKNILSRSLTEREKIGVFMAPENRTSFDAGYVAATQGMNSCSDVLCNTVKDRW